MPLTPIHPAAAPKAIGPYSPAVRTAAGALVWCSGQLPIDPATGDFVPGGVAEQTRRALLNLQATLEAAGSCLAQVAKTTVFLKDMAAFPEMNAVYAEFFPADPPARSTVEVARLPKDALVEIECVALAAG